MTAHTWIKHDGGPCLVHPRAIVEIRTRLGHSEVRYASNFNWTNAHRGSEYDITEYRVVEQPAEPVRTVRLIAWRDGQSVAECKMLEMALCFNPDAIETINFEDHIPVSSTFERVK